MASRPSLLDLRSASSASTSRPLRSPRLHVAGEVPPELSPLDAFALQSRLLARQLQETTKDGNRVSRLPPLTVESPLIVQGRSDYFRSMSADSGSDQAESPQHTPDGLGFRTEVEDAFPVSERPRSMHPRMSRIPPTPDERVPDLPESFGDLSRGRQASHAECKVEYFGARQERSPSPLRSDTQSLFDNRSIKSPVGRDYPLPSSFSTSSPRRPEQSSYDEIGLAPPRTLYPRRSSSILTSTTAVDDDAFGHMTGSVPALPSRKMSSGSAAFPHPIASPAVASFHRSPSVASESSALPRPAFNFSRPISRAGTPNLDLPVRQASSDSQPSFILADDSAQTPVSMHSEAFMDHGEDKNAASYIYSKFSLPRGKAVQRASSEDVRPQTAPQAAPSAASSANGHPIPAGAPLRHRLDLPAPQLGRLLMML
ncbi:hypothetical protein PT974_08773 [Cladobotryum mycophilum]|uniref:Uncharacterized protein n=1 Tax=Cladobotryum mycophilum TaxID=491253 RepID=A0ABR0SED8_9HYPO